MITSLRILLILSMALMIPHAKAEAPTTPTRVSMVQLLATPERFEGVVVEVSGYLEIAFESRVLYLHREDYTNRLLSNSLWVGASAAIEDARDNVHLKYVTLSGRFTSSNHGHMGLFPGALEDVAWVMRRPGT